MEPNERNNRESDRNGGAVVGFLNRIIDSILTFLHLFKYKEQIMYLIVGVGTTVIDWGIFTLLVFLMPDLTGLPFFNRFPNAIEYIAAWSGAVLFAYWASKYFVFEAAGKEGSVQFFKFVASRLLTLLISLFGDLLLTGILGINKFIAKLIVSILVIIINYITSKLLVFRKKRQEDSHDA